MKGPRSLIFYAWCGLAVQSLLVLGVIIFVLAGASYQSSAIKALQQRAQSMQLGNLLLQNEFLDTQRALRGYQVTHQDRFLQSYYDDQDRFVLTLRQLRQLAWREVLAGVSAQARTARSAFLIGDQAVVALPASGQAAGFYERASVSSDTFVAQSQRLQQRLTRQSRTLAAQSQSTLGIGLEKTAAVLALGLTLPVIAIALGLRWASRPLHDVTGMVRRRAIGDIQVRAVPGGPADVRDLATSINFLADEADRLKADEDERSRLQHQLREASTLIRQHLHAGDVIREAVTAIQGHLWADFAWVGLVSDGDLTLAEGDHASWEQIAGLAGILPPNAVTWIQELYRQRSSYCVQDLNSAQAEEIPPEIRKILLDLGTASLLVVTFGAGPDPLGIVTLLRNDLRKPWTVAEILAAESLAADIGRGLEHASLYESEEHLVAELRALDQAKTSFLASASHDLRTPLTSVLGYVEMLVDGDAGPIPPGQAKMLDAIGRNARRLNTLIEDMLTIYKMELGAFTSALKPVDIAELIQDSVTVIQPSAIEKGLSFELSTSGEALMVDGDADQLDRVVINLLSNAVKYTPDGGRVSMTALKDGDFALVTVADSGIGIPEQDQQSLFTRFFRASNAVARAIPGSGLGLSIVQSIVANHGGDIDLKSTEGQGTTVAVRIPLLGGRQAAGRGDAGQESARLAGASGNGGRRDEPRRRGNRGHASSAQIQGSRP